MIVKEFREKMVAPEEMSEFFRIDGREIPEDRPYVWYMFVMTADGIGS